jgi:hypothetical protein
MYVHVAQGALRHFKEWGGDGCSTATVWLPYASWKSNWTTRLGRSSLPASGVTQTKEDT